MLWKELFEEFILHLTTLMFFIAYAFIGQVDVFAGRLKIVSHLSCRTSAMFKYFCPLNTILILISFKRYFSHPEKSILNLSLP